MQALNASELLRVWEWGSGGVRPVERDLALLAVACPGVSQEVLSHLPLGARDKQILKLRELSFGQILPAYTECPACGAGVEFSFSGEDIMPDSQDVLPGLEALLRSATQRGLFYKTSDDSELNDELASITQLYELEIDHCQVGFRLPDSTDLLALKTDLDASTATDFILQRCVSKVVVEGVSATLEQLPESVLDKLIAQMAEYDSHADVVLSMTCPVCDQQWKTVFDIGEYLWREISVQAKELVKEVASLARTYGWSESEILAMTSSRRRLYLEVK